MSGLTPEEMPVAPSLVGLWGIWFPHSREWLDLEEDEYKRPEILIETAQLRFKWENWIGVHSVVVARLIDPASHTMYRITRAGVEAIEPGAR